MIFSFFFYLFSRKKYRFYQVRTHFRRRSPIGFFFCYGILLKSYCRSFKKLFLNIRKILSIIFIFQKKNILKY